MKKHLFLLTCFCTMMSAALPQKNARNGADFSPTGTMRMLVVFADVTGDPHSSDSIVGWPSGQLPRYKDSIIDVVFSNSMVSHISRFYQQSSFGTLQVIGDYYPYIVHVPYNSVSEENGYGVRFVTEYLNGLSGNIYTNSNLPLSSFDNWTPSDSPFKPKTQSPDDLIDILAVVWRVNSVFNENRDGGATSGHRSWPIKSMTGLNAFMNICIDQVSGCMRHEFAHKLLGGNEFHTGGAGVGKGHFLSNIGGYALLGSHNKNLYSCNGWDRWRLGWKHSSNLYYISARKSDDMTEVEADLEYGEPLEWNECVLRDFATYGDAVRIKLPYVKSIRPDADNQYLWIENHQLRQGMEEYAPAKPKGIRFNIQIGNDNLDSPNDPTSRTNYLVPLSAFGNYDFEYYFNSANAYPPQENSKRYTAKTTSLMENPFSGHHLLMYPAIDFNPADNKIFSKEYPAVLEVIYNGTRILGNHPIFGNQYDAFSENASLRMASNPPVTPLLTYTTKNRLSNIENHTKPNSRDNRHIFLNGLRVDVLEEDVDGNGAVKIRIRWDDFDIDRHVRWCDSIILTEKVILKPGFSITLDQGRTPVQPNNPMLFQQQSVFADPTVFTCMDGSVFQQKENSIVNVINNSSLIIKSGSTYIVEDNASLNLLSNSTLIVEDGATLKVVGRGHVEIEPSAHLCLGANANLILQNELSALNFHYGAVFGVDANIHPEASCATNGLGSVAFTGNGHFNYYGTSEYLQNRTFYNQSYLTGDIIRAGHHVTSSIPYGDVIVASGADVIIDTDSEAFLESGVEVQLGGVLEVR